MFFNQAKYVVFKLTERCNLRCGYCSLRDKDVTKNEDMTVDLFEYSLNQIVSQTQAKNVRILLFGGEPMLWGKRNAEAACLIARTMERQYNKKLKISIQSNLTMLDQEWIDIFKRYAVSVGASFDGAPSVHNIMRSHGEETLKGLQLLVDAKLKPGIIMVVGAHNVMSIRDTVELLLKVGVKACKIHEAADLRYNDVGGMLTPEQFNEQLRMVYEEYILPGKIMEGNIWLEMRRFIQHIDGLPRYDGICHCYNCGTGSKIFSIRPNGDLYGCGRWQNDSPGTRLGNIHDPDSELTMSRLKYVKDFVITKDATWEHCKDCREYPICRFTCTAFRTQDIGDATIDPFCCSRAKLFYPLFERDEARIRELVAQKGAKNAV